MTDQHSFRHLGHRDASEGGKPVHTPALDRLAESAGFGNAYCAAPLRTPSRLSLLTGREEMRAGGEIRRFFHRTCRRFPERSRKPLVIAQGFVRISRRYCLPRQPEIMDR